MEGRILAAHHHGAYALKFVGDVRVNLCNSIDDYLDHMFEDPEFQSVLVDLCEAEGVDSTTLGLLAKPMLVTLPCVLFLLDVWPLRRLRPEAEPGPVPPATLRACAIEKAWMLLLGVFASLATLFAQDAGLVLGCASGGRSTRAAQMLGMLGFTDLVNVVGGYSGIRDAAGNLTQSGWCDCGLPVEQGADEGSYTNMRAKARG